MTIANPKLKLDEDMSFYEIETSDVEEFEITPEIEAKNDEFMKKVFEPQVLRTVSICPCRMPEFMERNMRRAKLLGIPSEQVPPVIEQEDVDMLKYGVVILSDKGVHTGVTAIVQECRKCHRINYWGNADVFSRLVAEITTNYFSNKDELMSEPAEGTGDQPNNLIDASDMFGEGTFLETIEETGTPEPDTVESAEKSNE